MFKQRQQFSLLPIGLTSKQRNEEVTRWRTPLTILLMLYKSPSQQSVTPHFNAEMYIPGDTAGSQRVYKNNLLWQTHTHLLVTIKFRIQIRGGKVYKNYSSCWKYFQSLLTSRRRTAYSFVSTHIHTHITQNINRCTKKPTLRVGLF